jgi:oxygen-independent coproporphyrinogen-3 oxidase
MTQIASGQLAETIEELDLYDRFNEYVMTSLRTMWGTDLLKIENEFGKLFLADTLKNSKSFIQRNWLQHKNDSLILTQDGKLFADYIASELFLIQNQE